MALNEAAADAALDVWVDGLDPPPDDPTKTKDAMRGLFRAIYAGIVANAVVVPNDGVTTQTAGGDDVTGNARIT